MQLSGTLQADTATVDSAKDCGWTSVLQLPAVTITKQGLKVLEETEGGAET